MKTEYKEIPIDIDIIVVEDDTSVYVKFTGFEEIDQADEYADFLQEHLPLMLFHSEIKH